jgi:hypothetical protein
MAWQRLCAPGSDLAGSEWIKTVEAPGFDGLPLQHFYRTAAFLAGVRPPPTVTPLGPLPEPSPAGSGA